MSTDRVLAWLGVAIGILGLIPIFQNSSLQLRLAYAVALTLLLVLFIFLYRSGRGPQYATLSMTGQC
jgi:membrane protein implicated in regulation of membrane protease activity